jgi:hypothetical protein
MRWRLKRRRQVIPLAPSLPKYRGEELEYILTNRPTSRPGHRHGNGRPWPLTAGKVMNFDKPSDVAGRSQKEVSCEPELVYYPLSPGSGVDPGGEL